MKKTFDSVAFMRARRETLSREYAGISWEETRHRIENALKDDPLRQRLQDRAAQPMPRESMAVREKQKKEYGKS